MIRLLAALLLISSAAFGQDKLGVAGTYYVVDSIKLKDTVLTAGKIKDIRDGISRKKDISTVTEKKTYYRGEWEANKAISTTTGAVSDNAGTNISA